MTDDRGNNNTADRYLSSVDVWAIAFGCMVGWGVFAMPGNTFLPVAGPLGTMIAMVIGMAITLIVGNNFSYLMRHSSMSGGVYSYTKEAFGRDHAFLSTWFLCLSYLTIVFLNGTAMFYIIRLYMGNATQSGIRYTIAGNDIYLGEAIVAAIFLAGTGILIMVAGHRLQRLNTIMSVVLLTGILIMAVACLPEAIRSGALTDMGSRDINGGYAILSIVILSPWAFVGFEVTSFDAAHFNFPAGRTKKLIILSVIGTALAYIAMLPVSVSAVPDGFGSWQEYINNLDSLTGASTVPTFFAVRSVMGNAGLIVMVITALAAILTGIIGGYRATTHVLSTMAEDHILSEKFTKTSYSIFFIMIISIVLSFFGRNTLNWFVDLTSFGAIVGFGYTSAAAWKIASTEGNKRVAVSGITGAVISAIFIIVQLIPRLSAMETMGSEAFLMLAVWCLVGFLFYWRTVNHSTLTEFSGISTSGVVLFALLIYSSLMWLAKRIVAMESAQEMKRALVWGGAVVMVIIFIGLMIMLYVQNLVRKKHEAAEREKIRAVEGSLAKSRFLFNMSHDIRTPMNAIIGYTALALKEPAEPKLHEYLEKIDMSGKHLLELINDILEMSRIESGKVELEYVPVDLCAVFDGIRDLFSEQMKQKNMTFSVYTSQVRNRYVWCDKKNLNRVLLNIISNAYKFTPADGTVNASLWEIGSGTDGYGSYEIRIQDNGIGMSREFAARMFTAFERERTSTDSGVEGTGLGLSITKSIIDLMGGTIDVITSPGNGTEIIIKLKMKLALPEEIADVEDDNASPSEVDFRGRRVLLVEDNAINMEIADMILSQMGFEVDNAENGKLAVDKVAASAPGYYDIVLMDIQMPVMDGYTATREIRALESRELSEVPIVAMTANAFAEDVKASMEAGMQGHIAKPIDIDILKNTLSEVLK